ncbi:MAG: DUF5658 family protein [Paracoccaceae bacterium]
MTIALFAFMLANVIDVVTTLEGLERGAKEGNGVIAWAMRKLGRGWVVLKLVAAGFAAYWIFTDGAVWMLWVLTAIIMAVAYRNHTIAR